ncbi:uncharacterized protein ACLA_097960 [Aspergillus clavatus NRRL 1]|uniref:Uncharacterized protein n=1 Tax=Aspergillus clavatus (strain ATCC 1007 / CBS 513.65 / DSM 816 / NCTC 3887 / NRRL 1 / QM 1276 / 107) TaxID=344612 RepID=A1CMR7_ASPCL|nr:uncharacterized protein ACLA_097960 [Aspergillus clavatus NRRL 1]EAW08854.1 conserved hypothetical protein [Aspergillus clavatus NRRL 1]
MTGQWELEYLHRLSPFANMKLLKTTNYFVMRYVPQTKIPPVAARYLGSNTNPIRVKVQDMYTHRNPETLWWRVSLQPLQSFKRVVRSWGARRARLAFRQALAARGFDPEGRRLVSQAQGSETEQQSLQGLKGSLEFIVRPQSVKDEYAAVRKEMDYLLHTLLTHLRAGERQAKSRTRKEGKDATTKIPMNTRT